MNLGIPIKITLISSVTVQFVIRNNFTVASTLQRNLCKKKKISCYHNKMDLDLYEPNRNDSEDTNIDM